MKLTLTVKSIYGRALYYPTCDAGQTLVDLIGAKALSPKHLPIVKRMGFELDIQPDPAALSLAQ